MKKVLIAVAAALALAGAAQAEEFSVQGSNASGRAGEQVFIDLTYNYGDGFEIIVEDFAVDYSTLALNFLPGASTIDTFGPPQSLTDYAQTLKSFASTHGGNMVENLAPQGLADDLGGYRISFFTDGLAGQMRHGEVHLRAAFAIKADAAPGVYRVSFGEANTLVDINESEYSYPGSLQGMSITVLSAVPEPTMALLLLPGLALVGWQAKRRRS